jgi:hypothetical protein
MCTPVRSVDDGTLGTSPTDPFHHGQRFGRRAVVVERVQLAHRRRNKMAAQKPAATMARAKRMLAKMNRKLTRENGVYKIEGWNRCLRDAKAVENAVLGIWCREGKKQQNEPIDLSGMTHVIVNKL